MIDRASLPSVLAVRLHGRRIGTIVRLAGDRNIFAFEEDYIEDPNRATLSLSYHAPNGALKTAVRAVRTRLPPFFSNLLPEEHLREYLAARSGVKPAREFFLLHALGADLPGALHVSAEDYAPDEDFPPPPSASPPRQNAPLRFSLAGAQLKFSALAGAPGGLTIPAQGIGGRWIVKLPSSRFAALPENEFVMLELARRIGIPVPPSRLIDTDDIAGLPDDIGDIAGTALAVERFDRLADGTPVHIEDFAQIFGLFPERKYERRSYDDIAAFLWTRIGTDAVLDFAVRVTFSLLIGNADFHLKNLSLIYRDGRAPSLAPAYDLVATLPHLPNDALGLRFGGSKDIHTLSRERIRRFAESAGLAAHPLWRAVCETCERARESWRDLDAKAILPAKTRAAVSRNIERVAHSITAG